MARQGPHIEHNHSPIQARQIDRIALAVDEFECARLLSQELAWRTIDRCRRQNKAVYQSGRGRRFELEGVLADFSVQLGSFEVDREQQFILRSEPRLRNFGSVISSRRKT